MKRTFSQAEAQVIINKIKAILDESGAVLTRGLEADEFEAVIRPRLDSDPELEFDVFDRFVYLSRSVDPLNPDERNAFDSWKAQYQQVQKDEFPRPELRTFDRLDGVEFLTHQQFYDGPLAGLCKHNGRIAYYAVIEQYTSILLPRVFCLWYLDEQSQDRAKSLYQSLLDSGWSHLAYKDDTRAGAYEGGDMPDASFYQELMPLRGWIQKTWPDLDNFEAAHPVADGREPDGWFTYANRLSSKMTPEQELASCISWAMDDLVERWDSGERPVSPQ